MTALVEAHEKKRRYQAEHDAYMAGCKGKVVSLCMPRVIEPTAPCPRCGRDGIHKSTANGSRFWCRYCQGWYDQDGHLLHPNDV